MYLEKCFYVRNLATMTLQDFRNTAKPLCLRWARPYADIIRCTAEALAAPKTQGSCLFKVLDCLDNSC